MKTTRIFSFVIKLTLIFLLINGYSWNLYYSTDYQASFPELFVIILNDNLFFSFPMLFLYLLLYERLLRNTRALYTIVNHLVNAAAFLGIIILSIITCYLAQGSSISLYWPSRSVFDSISVMAALSLTILFMFMRLLFFSALVEVVKIANGSEWLGYLVVLAISFIDTSLRDIFNTAQFIGIIPSDHTLVYYNLNHYLSASTRPAYLASFLYWLVLLLVTNGLSIYMVRKKNAKRLIKEVANAKKYYYF